MPSANETKVPYAPKKRSLAPDGRPWPAGYFDREPRQTLEKAIAIHGVRPSFYRYGWPAYTPEDMALPGFKSAPPPESPELEEKWRNECDEWDAKHEKSNGVSVQ